MELKLGKMTTKELAIWFGMSEKSYSNRRLEKLEELSSFASFEPVYGGVIIKDIVNPVYNRQESKAYRQVLEKLDATWAASGLDSCSNVAQKLEQEIDTIKPSTLYAYTRKGRNELYGVPFSEVGGKLGKCQYLWCKKEPNGEYRQLTPEEEGIKQDLIKKYFGKPEDISDKVIFVNGMVEMGEIKEEDAYKYLKELTNMRKPNFLGFLRELQEKLDCKIIRGTMVERYALPPNTDSYSS